jgi:3-hydroxybutyrate dehydrogenase
MRPLSGRCALVTGSTQGLGLAIARALSAAGCDLVLNGFGSSASISTLRAELQSCGGRALHHAADLRRADEIVDLVREARSAFGSLDILVNNAVVRHVAPVDGFPAAAWDEALAVNLSAPFHVIRAALPAMKSAGWGRIVNIGSIYAIKGVVNRVAYVSTKTALVGLTRAVALETAGTGITCNVVCPGTADTPVHDAAIRRAMEAGALPRHEAERRFLAQKQPSGRFVSPEHVAALVTFLCGAEAADITGAVLPIDGGWSAA